MLCLWLLPETVLSRSRIAPRHNRVVVFSFQVDERLRYWQKVRDWRRKKALWYLHCQSRHVECNTKGLYSSATVTSSCSLEPKGKINTVWMQPSVPPPIHLSTPLFYHFYLGLESFVCTQTSSTSINAPPPPQQRSALLCPSLHPQIRPGIQVQSMYFILWERFKLSVLIIKMWWACKAYEKVC